MSVKYSVIVPTMGEKELYSGLLSKINVLETYLKDVEFVIVNDGGDVGVVNRVIDSIKKEKNIKIKVKHFKKNKGKGKAVLTGASMASGKFLIFIDADNDILPKILLDFVKKAEQNSAIVYANKYMQGSVYKRPVVRRLLSRLFVVLIHFGLGVKVKDTQTGAKMYRKDVWEQIQKHKKLFVEGFAYEVENAVVATQLGYKIDYVPVHIMEPTKSSFEELRSLSVKKYWRVLKDLLRIFKQYRLAR